MPVLGVAKFEPFPGVRYDAGSVGLDQVIAPPYDVVGSAERDLLAHRSPYNAIHLELPEPDLAAGRDRYLAAAELLDSWLDRRVLVADAQPAFYPYRMTTRDGLTTTGVVGTLGIGDDVLPHEETMPKPKSDRLDLLRATGANLSPIWGLSLAAGMTGLVDTEGPPAQDAYDDDGVRHQLWVMDDPALVAKLSEVVAGSPVVIADGHHRYETATTYRNEARQANRGRPGDYDSVMALVVELAEDELHVGPIHRMVSGLPAGTDLVTVLGQFFDAVHAGETSERVVSALGSSGALALFTPGDSWLLTVRPGAFEAAGTDLVTGLVDRCLAEVPDATIAHTGRWQEARSALSAGEAEAVVLLHPVTVAQISEWAAARRRMPPKTTYFVPKPRTGMVFRVLSD